MNKVIRRTIQIPQGAKIGPSNEPIYGYKDISAYCAGGLAVHRTGPGNRWKWTVTHESSGLAIGVLGGMTKTRATENMMKALELEVDWTMPENEILKFLRDSKDIVKKLREIGNSN